ncbi:helicase-associated domain-containing protein [bacterium]|nr:helicase-associated domain-containing protein [bacterium]
MKLMEILVNLPIEDLQQIAYKSGSTGFFHSKADLIRNIFEHLNDEDYIIRLLRKLSGPCKEFLKIVLMTDNESRSAARKKAGKANLLKEYEKDKHFRVLQDAGLIFAINGLCQIPDDLGQRIRACFQSEWYDDFMVSPNQTMTIKANGLTFYYDLYHLLAFISKNEVRLTQKNTIYARTFERLQKLLLSANGSGEHKQADTLHQIRNLSFTVIFNFALLSGLIVKQARTFVLGTNALKWIMASPLEQYLSVFDYFQNREGPMSRYWDQFVALLHNLGINCWIDCKQFFRKLTLIASTPDQGEQKSVDDCASFFLEPLHLMGLVDIGQMNNGDIAFRINSLGKSVLNRETQPGMDAGSSALVIQPNFELLVPQDLPFAQRWKIESIADIVAVGKMDTYSLNKESVIRGLKNGLEPDIILDLLGKLSRARIPQNIEQTIRDWSEVYGQVKFGQGILVHCTKPEIARIISSIPAIKPMIVQQLTPCDLLINPDDLESLRLLLEQNDIVPVPGIFDVVTLFSSGPDKSKTTHSQSPNKAMGQ